MVSALLKDFFKDVRGTFGDVWDIGHRCPGNRGGWTMSTAFPSSKNPFSLERLIGEKHIEKYTIRLSPALPEEKQVAWTSLVEIRCTSDTSLPEKKLQVQARTLTRLRVEHSKTGRNGNSNLFTLQIRKMKELKLIMFRKPGRN